MLASTQAQAEGLLRCATTLPATDATARRVERAPNEDRRPGVKKGGLSSAPSDREYALLNAELTP
jgi:hypothetical protein